MPKVLLTGFEPFNQETLNPSKELLLRLSRNFEGLLLPVSFRNAWPILKEKVRCSKPDIVLMMGQAGGRKSVMLERVAINRTESEIPDKEGFLPGFGEVVPGGPAAYISELPLKEWRDLAHQRQLKIEVSNSAGLFVCNYVYYQMLMQFQRQGRIALFVHFPFLLEQMPGKPGCTPCLNYAQMEESMSFIIQQATDCFSRRLNEGLLER